MLFRKVVTEHYICVVLRRPELHDTRPLFKWAVEPHTVGVQESERRVIVFDMVLLVKAIEFFCLLEEGGCWAVRPIGREYKLLTDYVAVRAHLQLRMSLCNEIEEVRTRAVCTAKDRAARIQNDLPLAVVC